MNIVKRVELQVRTLYIDTDTNSCVQQDDIHMRISLPEDVTAADLIKPVSKTVDDVIDKKRSRGVRRGAQIYV
jgi:hypothetical protein